jgi:hypothetical protein
MGFEVVLNVKFRFFCTLVASTDSRHVRADDPKLTAF